MRRIGFFASRNGSGMRALVAARETGVLDFVPALLVASKPDIGAYRFAVDRGIAAEVIDEEAYGSPQAAAAAMVDALRGHAVELVFLVGYLRLLPPEVIREYDNKIFNIHPSLLPKHGGKGMFGLRVHERVLASKDKFSGATIHIVNERYDEGRVVAQAVAPVLPNDTATSLAARVRDLEDSLIVAVVRNLLVLGCW